MGSEGIHFLPEADTGLTPETVIKVLDERDWLSDTDPDKGVGLSFEMSGRESPELLELIRKLERYVPINGRRLPSHVIVQRHFFKGPAEESGPEKLAARTEHWRQWLIERGIPVVESSSN